MGSKRADETHLWREGGREGGVTSHRRTTNARAHVWQFLRHEEVKDAFHMKEQQNIN